jgi:flagellar hook-basal body complex protein FliE
LALPPLSPGSLPLLPPHIDGGVEVGKAPHLEGDQAEPSAFEKLFANTVASTNERLQSADSAARDFASGKTDDIHGTMIAVTQADIELRLLGTMKNKVVDAFYELWRMQI